MNNLKLRLLSIHSPRWRRLFSAVSGEHRFPHSHLQSSHYASPRPNSFSTHQSPKFQTPQKHSINSVSDIFDESSVLESLSSYNNDYKRALEFFNWLETGSKFNHTTKTFNKMIDILGKFFEFDIAWELIDKMSKTNRVESLPDHVTFRVMFKRYVSARLVKEAVNTYSRLNEFGLKDEMSFRNLVDALCEYKHVIEAEELCLGKGNMEVGEMFFDGKDTRIFNMILRGYFKLSWWRKCREFWEEMDKRGVEKDLFSYSIYMDIQCKSGKPWKAVKLYKEMKRKGIRLDVVAYNTIFRAVVQCDGVDAAMRVYREMRESGLEASVSSFNVLVKFLCDNGRYKEAYEVLDKMSGCGCPPNVITYHCLFTCLEKPKEILELFDRMFKSGVLPQMDTYVLLIRKFGRWGFLRPIFVVWEKMEEQKLSPDEFAYNALIDALLEKGMVDMARKYDEEMLEKGLSAKPRAELGTKLMQSQD
ncbi:Pentatricopeptide repeat-containing protein, mitochondrial [Heracleum sosnowskyi]|uniref:Pentatricopeptide repeat-containing protein, mitochondrial n=1 Tax=Heracleum sosnowskyi TaxID=360622 RepID=A0AAD8H6P5_9APIA|nr:Pentatricopeptide repeat-containing protein, mitochondrial [Heracleum sosnowskyi]